MPTDATGSPTTPDSIATLLGTDAPTKTGINNIIASIQTALTARMGSVASQVDFVKIKPGTDGQFLKTVGSTPAWGAGPTAQAKGLLPGFGLTNLTASQTDLQLRRWIASNTGTEGSFTISLVMPRAGSITGITVSGNAARTAGTATFKVFKNGTDVGLSAVINGTDTQFAVGTQAAGTDTFVAGDRLDVRVTTDGTFAPVTTEYEAMIEVTFD